MNGKRKENETATEIMNKSGNNSNKENVIKSKSNTRKSTYTSKIRNLEKKIETIENEKSELKEQLLRKAAEFENYKKRRENEYLQILENANAELITELLPILDDFERSLQSTNDKKDLKGFYKGVELIYKNLINILQKRGVKPIKAVGLSFDPDDHDALLQVESKDYPSGTVVEEHLKGYVMNGRVLRHSQVIVSK